MVSHPWELLTSQMASHLAPIKPLAKSAEKVNKERIDDAMGSWTNILLIIITAAVQQNSKFEVLHEKLQLISCV